MAAGKYDFTIEQGATWEKVLTYKTPAGVPVDLTGYTARMMAKVDFDEEPYIDITTENGGIEINGPDGVIRLIISAENTADIETMTGRYDLEIESGGTVTRLLQGTIFLSREVTKP